MCRMSNTLEAAFRSLGKHPKNRHPLRITIHKPTKELSESLLQMYYESELRLTLGTMDLIHTTAQSGWKYEEARMQLTLIEKTNLVKLAHLLQPYVTNFYLICEWDEGTYDVGGMYVSTVKAGSFKLVSGLNGSLTVLGHDIPDELNTFIIGHLLRHDY